MKKNKHNKLWGDKMDSEEVDKILKEILKWQKIQGRENLKRLIEKECLFSDGKEILVYYYSDGHKSSREIEKITGVKYKKVQSLWKKWVNVGIAGQTEKYSGGRCSRLFELNELGLESPKIKNK